MKQLLFILLFLPYGVNAQQLARETVGSTEGQILRPDGVDSNSDGKTGPYAWRVNSTQTDDGIWVIQPNGWTDPGRWEFIINPAVMMTQKTVSTSTYTIAPSDFNKTIIFTYNGARTITMPSIATVNTTQAVRIKDGSNSAGSTAITINSSDGIDNGSSIAVNSNNGEIGLFKNIGTNKYSSN